MTLSRQNTTERSLTYQLLMLALCIFALTSLAAQIMFPIGDETRKLLQYADNAVCVLFFGDFLWSFARAENRLRYMVTWGWLDLLSSIPTLEVARWGRIARILRVLRVLRGLRATRLLASVVLRRRAQNTFLSACLIALLLIIFCSIAVLHFETDPSSNIRTAEDALWWSVTTITTVGYGDRYPVTPEGRMTAVILMTAGVGLFGVFSGFLAAWFLRPEEDEINTELERLREEIAALRRLIESGREPR